ncbi:MFS transporter, partial [Actinomadura kijaniata]
RVDGAGTVLLSLTLASLLVPLTEGRSTGWPVWSWVLLGAFPFAAAAFWAVERRMEAAGRTPLVPPSLLRIGSVRSGLAVLVPFS